MTEEEYYRLIQPYEDACGILLARLNVLNHNLYDQDASPPIHMIQHRIKGKRSMEEKLKLRSLEPTEANAKSSLRDIAGIRVICYFSEDIYNLTAILRRQSDLVFIRERDYIKTPKPNGYRSFHLIAGVPVYCLDGMEYFPVEVQLRTISMDFWASMEHRICYKKDNAEKDKLSKELYHYAESLQKLERKFEKYRETGKLQA